MLNLDDGDPLRVLELYAGIGGMHFAINAATTSLKMRGGADYGKETSNFKFISVDINPAAKIVYDANFPSSPSQQLDIRALPHDTFENLWMLTMSPPCQPFSRNGNFLDVEDFRCESFLWVLDKLSRLKAPPRYILMENVKGFELSQARARFMKVLHLQKYHFQESLVSPVDLGLPNSRLRYYLTAVRRKSEIFSDTPSSRTDFDATIELMENDNSPVVHNVDLKKSLVLWRVLPLSECLLPVMKGQDDTELLIPLDTLAKYITVLDIKHPESVSTNCFTSGYGRYLKGTGSVFCPHPRHEFDRLMTEFETSVVEGDKLNSLEQMKIRYFSPEEVAGLMGFPATFVSGPGLTLRQMWRLLGNSLNVLVVSRIMIQLLQKEGSTCEQSTACATE